MSDLIIVTRSFPQVATVFIPFEIGGERIDPIQIPLQNLLNSVMQSMEAESA